MGDPSTNPGGSPAPAAAAVATPPPAPAGSPAASAPPPSSSNTGATSVGAPSAAAPAGSTQPAGASSPGLTPQQAQLSGVRDALRSQGIDPSAFADDAAALRHLAEQSRQYQGIQPYLPHLQQVSSPDYQAWLAQRQGQQRPAAPAQDKPWWSKHWQAPEYDPAWEQMVRDDGNGNIVPVQGAPFDIPAKIAAFKTYQREQINKLLANPYSFLEGGVKDLVRQEAQQLVQQQLGQYQDSIFAREFTQQNADWLYQKDATGQYQTQAQLDPRTGQVVQQRVLSAWGGAFRGYVEQAGQLGISDLQKQKDYALGMVQRDYLLSQNQQAGAQTAGNQANQQFLQNAAGRQATHTPNSTGSLPGQPGVPPAAPQVPPQNGNLPLRQQLAAAFQRQGMNSHDVVTVRQQ